MAPLAAWADDARPSSADVQRQIDDAFKDVITQVDSREARLKYAQLLVQAHNFEGGIAGLESMLLSPNAPPSIRVELAVLYYRLGSYGISEAYLREALDDSRLDSDLRKQAQTMLADVVKRNKASSLTGSLMAALRVQSNPAAASSEANVLSSGTLVPRLDRFAPKSDVDAILWGKLDHAYDLGMQNEATVVTSLIGLMDHYSRVSSYSYQPGNGKPFDVATFAGSFGVRFKPLPEQARGFTLLPHVVLGDSLLNGHQYFSANGLGLEGGLRVNERLKWNLAYEVRDFFYASRPDIVDSTLPSGTRDFWRLQGVAEVGANKVLTGEVGYVDQHARRSDYAFRGPEAKLAYIVSYADPAFRTGLNWTTTLAGSATRRDYRGADPSVDPGIVRSDTEYRLSLLNVMRMTPELSVQFELTGIRVPSNVPNYKYSNVLGSVGILWDF